MARLGAIVAEVDRELRYVWIDNPHPDFRQHDVLGKRDDELIEGAEATALTDLKKEVLTTREPRARILAFMRSDGRHIYSINAFPISEDDDGLRGVLTISFEISTRS
jgi:hypothetical protein